MNNRGEFALTVDEQKHLAILWREPLTRAVIESCFQQMVQNRMNQLLVCPEEEIRLKRNEVLLLGTFLDTITRTAEGDASTDDQDPGSKIRSLV